MKNIFTLPVILVFIYTTLAINSCSSSNEPPSAYIRLPLDNSSYFMGEIMDISMGASDMDGIIKHVEISLNGTSIAILNSKPYFFSYEINNIQPGDYKLEVVATDDKNRESSKEIKITVNPALEVFTDSRDGNTYRYVTIGKQTWMIDNLAYLPGISSPTEESLDIPFYYVLYYEGNDVSAAKQTEEYSKFGVLYNWEAAKQAAPEGWHLPNVNEWQELLDYMEIRLGERSSTPDGLSLLHPNEGGTNHCGFSAAIAGLREPIWEWHLQDVSYKFNRERTAWWTCSEEENIPIYPNHDEESALSVYVRKNKNNGDAYVNWQLNSRNLGMSVRCIKD